MSPSKFGPLFIRQPSAAGKVLNLVGGLLSEEAADYRSRLTRDADVRAGHGPSIPATTAAAVCPCPAPGIWFEHVDLVVRRRTRAFFCCGRRLNIGRQRRSRWRQICLVARQKDNRKTQR